MPAQPPWLYSGLNEYNHTHNMPKIKEVPNSEVHWQVAGLNIKDAANARIKIYMGADAQYFAPVYVSHTSYYWSDPDPEGWQALTTCSPADQDEARRIISEIRARAVKRTPAREAAIGQFLTFPNDDFILVRRRSGDHLEVRLTGWGFANFNRARAVRITDTIEQTNINEITVSFSVDGEPVPGRKFLFARGVDWVEESTDDKGYYSFGQHMPGAHISVRDKNTGIEKVTVVDENTTNIDVDVTEYLRVRVVARHDGVPVSGESASGTYGRRTMEFALIEGACTQTLPWYEGEECTITFRGQSQRRELNKEQLNEFLFESETPRQPHTTVVVHVSDHGQPVLGEVVDVQTPEGPYSLVSNPDGIATLEYDMYNEGMIVVSARGKQESKAAVDGTVEFFLDLDTPVPVEFDCYLRTVNQSDEPMGLYPVSIQLGRDGERVDCLTDENGLIGPIHVTSGDVMIAYDGNRPDNSEEFTLDATQQEYIFKLPYDSTDNLGDVSLRVVLRNGQPAAGVTCILTQDNTRITAALNNNGMMTFGSDDFDMKRPLKVDLYSPERNFPPLELPLSPDEKEYELVEVDGPQPWWKLAGEIALAAISLLGFVGLYFGLEAIYSRIPYLFG